MREFESHSNHFFIIFSLTETFVIVTPQQLGHASAEKKNEQFSARKSKAKKKLLELEIASFAHTTTFDKCVS